MKISFCYIFPVLFLYVSCQQKTDTSLSPADFKTQAEQPNAQILDVRTMAEYTSGHIHSSLLADWENQGQFMDRVKYVDKTKPVYVYCLSGGRSAAAAKWMRANGYNNVYELKGGINAWKNNSLPLDGAPNIKQLTPTEYQSQISNDGVTLVDFSAEWCPPCKKMEPVIAQLQKDMGSRFHFVKIDAGVQTDIMKQLDIESIPVFIIYKSGKEIWRKEGITELSELKQQITTN